MPHATSTTMSTGTVTNGEKPNSQFINHLTSYPLIADTLSIYQQNSLGAKSIELFHKAYDTFATPVLPYLHTPLSFVQPYLERADSLGDASLQKVDEHFPAVKETGFAQLKSTSYHLAAWPFRVAGDGRDYVLRTYGDEYARTKGADGADGILVAGQAIVSTELRIALEAFQAAWELVQPRADEAQRRFGEAKKSAWKKVEQARANGEAKLNEVRKQAGGK